MGWGTRATAPGGGDWEGAPGLGPTESLPQGQGGSESQGHGKWAERLCPGERWCAGPVWALPGDRLEALEAARSLDL